MLIPPMTNGFVKAWISLGTTSTNEPSILPTLIIPCFIKICPITVKKTLIINKTPHNIFDCNEEKELIDIKIKLMGSGGVIKADSIKIKIKECRR